jgi:hypothetical protein
MGNCRVRLGRAAGVLCSAALTLTSVGNAQAFNLKHTPDGLDIRWNSQSVSFVVDPQLDEAVNGGAAAVAQAAQAWSAVAGAPTVSAATGAVGAAPAVDMTNSVLFLHNFAPAEGALAITIVSAEASTGYIVDTDIVVNADHAFAVLPSGARASSSSPLVSTEGNSYGGSSQVFDLTHVTAHEVGHALGLADESSNAAALMYPYTRAGDASVRTPGSDDLSGIDEAYAGADLSSGGAQGCGGGASVAGRRGANGSSWFAALLLACAAGSLVSRRPRRRLAPIAVALVAVLAGSGRAQSASISPVEATARVSIVTTGVVNGVFQTTLDVVPQSCHLQLCPEHAVAHLWGGTMNGITQQVGEAVVPALNDDVDVAFRPLATGEVGLPTAVVLAIHPAAARSPAPN